MASKRFISLPKPHFSYSQWSLWLSNPERYKQIYFDKREDVQFTNRGQSYGKMVADALEAQVDTGDLLTDAATLLLPKYDVQDAPIFVDVKTKHGWLNLIAKPDTYNSETHDFVEFKTGKGKNPWTPEKAQNHLQMWFYAVVIWQKFGVVLDKAQLSWVETEDVPPYVVTVNDQKITMTIAPTGRVETFDVHFSKAGLMDALARIIKSAHEIEVAWAGHITKPWITTF